MNGLIDKLTNSLMVNWLKVKRFSCVLVVVSGLSGASPVLAGASDSNPGSHAVDVSQAEPFGDAANGKTLSVTCAACHGATGDSAVPSFPKLAGQVESYTYKQLKDMASGAREVPEMTAFVASLSDQDMRDLAAYYYTQPISLAPVPKDLLEAGATLYAAGDRASGIPACAACHGAQGKGVLAAGYPALGGQHAAYIESQLKAYRAAGRGDSGVKQRNNDGDDIQMMRTLAAKLSDDQIKAVSAYVSGLH